MLFIPSNGNHVKIFHPIYETLKNKFHIVFLSQESYKKEGAEKILLELGIDFKKIDEYQKKNPTDILKKENVGAVIIGNDTDIIPQWFINSANQLNIPSVLIQDGLMFDISKKQKNSKLNSNLKLLFLEFKLLLLKQYRRVSDGQGKCTQIHVWGEVSKDYFLKKNVSQDKIFITGRIGSNIPINKKINKPKEWTILLARTNLIQSGIMKMQSYEQLFHTLCSSILERKMKLIVKPHPNEDQILFSKFVAKYTDHITVSDDDLHALLEKSDILVTDFSTVAIEALVHHIPVILFFPNISKFTSTNSFPLDLIEQKIVLYAENQQQFSMHLDAIMEDRFNPDVHVLKQVLQNYLGSNDDTSVKRSADLISNLLDN